MREFCLDLSPSNAREINRCINELLPFVIFVDQQQFQELVEQSPPPLPKASLFPLRKKVYYHKFEKQNEKEKSPLEEQQQKFNIWKKYGIYFDKKKQPRERKLL